MSREPQSEKISFKSIFVKHFEEVVGQYASHAAIKTQVGDEKIVLTYQQLNARVNQLAHYIRDKAIHQGWEKESRILLFLDPSLEAVISILAVMKTGFAYVPVNVPAASNDGVERLKKIFESCTPQLILSHSKHKMHAFLDSIASGHAAKLSYLDQLSLNSFPEQNLNLKIAMDQLAYLIFTSGTTGEPKGVAVEHKGLINCMEGIDKTLKITPDDCMAQFAAIGFDASLQEIMNGLGKGACLYIVPKEHRLHVSALGNCYRENNVTVGTFVPSMLEALNPEKFPSLRTIISTGEAITKELIEKWQKIGRTREIINGYGPTEVTICTTLGPYDGKDANIGKPIMGLELFVLNPDDKSFYYDQKQHAYSVEEVKPGERGELFIGGIGLARGYWKKPELTSQRFLRIFHPKTQEVVSVFRTRDEVLLNPQTLNYEIKGRLDRQVKIYGQLFCPEEAELILESHPLFKEFEISRVYFDAKMEKAHPNFTLFITSAKKPDFWSIYHKLLKLLPFAALPAKWVYIPENEKIALLNASGKWDVKKLRTLPSERIQLEVVRELTTEEKELAELWKQVLPYLEKDYVFTPESNFYYLGGTSLLAARLVELFNQKYKSAQVRMTLQELNSKPLLAHFARKLRRKTLLQTNPFYPLIEVHSRYPLNDFKVNDQIMPLFLIPDFQGDPLEDYKDLMRCWSKQEERLKDHRPVFGIRARGLNDALDMDDSVEDLAADYVEGIKKIQPRGLYLLFGKGMGGIICQEMARQLRRQGNEVNVFILDGLSSSQWQTKTHEEFFLQFLIPLLEKNQLPHAEVKSAERQKWGNLCKEQQIFNIFAPLLAKTDNNEKALKLQNKVITIRSHLIALLHYMEKGSEVNCQWIFSDANKPSTMIPGAKILHGEEILSELTNYLLQESNTKEIHYRQRFGIPIMQETFIERTGYIEVLRKYLCDEKVQEVVISGPVGMGKTSLARLCLQDPSIKKRFGIVGWLNAHNEIELENSLALFLKNKIGLTKTLSWQEQIKIIYTYSSAYFSKENILLIFDNAARAFMEQFLKFASELERPKGLKYLITTQSSEWQESASFKKIILSPFGEKEGRRYLSTALKVQPQEIKQVEHLTTSLARKLHYIPGVLSQAVLQINKTAENLPVELRLSKYMEKLETKAVLPSGHSVAYSVFQDSINKVSSYSPHARMMLNFLALISAHGVSPALLERIENVQALELLRLLQELCEFSILTQDSGSRNYSMNTLALEIINSSITTEEMLKCLQLGRQLFNALFFAEPLAHTNTWKISIPAFRHAKQFILNLSKKNMLTEDDIELIFNMAVFAIEILHDHPSGEKLIYLIMQKCLMPYADAKVIDKNIEIKKFALMKKINYLIEKSKYCACHKLRDAHNKEQKGSGRIEHLKRIDLIQEHLPDFNQRWHVVGYVPVDDNEVARLSKEYLKQQLVSFDGDINFLKSNLLNSDLSERERGHILLRMGMRLVSKKKLELLINGTLNMPRLPEEVIKTYNDSLQCFKNHWIQERHFEYYLVYMELVNVYQTCNDFSKAYEYLCLADDCIKDLDIEFFRPIVDHIGIEKIHALCQMARYKEAYSLFLVEFDPQLDSLIKSFPLRQINILNRLFLSMGRYTKIIHFDENENFGPFQESDFIKKFDVKKLLAAFQKPESLFENIGSMFSLAKSIRQVATMTDLIEKDFVVVERLYLIYLFPLALMVLDKISQGVANPMVVLSPRNKVKFKGLLHYWQAKLKIKNTVNLSLADVPSVAYKKMDACKDDLLQAKSLFVSIEDNFNLSLVFNELSGFYFEAYFMNPKAQQLNQQRKHSRQKAVKCQNQLANNGRHVLLQHLIYQRESLRARYWLQSDYDSQVNSELLNLLDQFEAINSMHPEVGRTFLDLSLLSARQKKFEESEYFFARGCEIIAKELDHLAPRDWAEFNGYLHAQKFYIHHKLFSVFIKNTFKKYQCIITFLNTVIRSDLDFKDSSSIIIEKQRKMILTSLPSTDSIHNLYLYLNDRKVDLSKIKEMEGLLTELRDKIQKSDDPVSVYFQGSVHFLSFMRKFLDSIIEEDGAVREQKPLEITLSPAVKKLAAEHKDDVVLHRDQSFTQNPDTVFRNLLDIITAFQKTQGVSPINTRIIESENHCLVQIHPNYHISIWNTSEKTVPLFLVHSLLGNPHEDYESLIKEWMACENTWGRRRPVFALKARRLQDKKDIDVSLEELAADYIKSMQLIYSGEVYLLAGWSAGGAICYEIARQLQVAGKEVYFVAIDSACPLHLQQISNSDFAYHFFFPLLSDISFLRPYLPASDQKAQIANLAKEAQVNFLLNKNTPSSKVKKDNTEDCRRITVRSMLLALLRYSFKKFDVNMELIVAGKSARDWKAWHWENGGRLGWADSIKNIHIEASRENDDHFSLLRSTNLESKQEGSRNQSIEWLASYLLKFCEHTETLYLQKQKLESKASLELGSSLIEAEAERLHLTTSIELKEEKLNREQLFDLPIDPFHVYAQWPSIKKILPGAYLFFKAQQKNASLSLDDMEWILAMAVNFIEVTHEYDQAKELLLFISENLNKQKWWVNFGRWLVGIAYLMFIYASPTNSINGFLLCLFMWRVYFNNNTELDKNSAEGTRWRHAVNFYLLKINILQSKVAISNFSDLTKLLVPTAYEGVLHNIHWEMLKIKHPSRLNIPYDESEEEVQILNLPTLGLLVNNFATVKQAIESDLKNASRPLFKAYLYMNMGFCIYIELLVQKNSQRQGYIRNKEKYHEVIECYQKAIAILKDYRESDLHIDLYEIYFNLGRVQLKLGALMQAYKSFGLCLSCLNFASLQRYRSVISICHLELIDILRHMGRYKEAGLHVDKYFQTLDEKSGNLSARSIRILSDYYIEVGQYQKAEEITENWRTKIKNIAARILEFKNSDTHKILEKNFSQLINKVSSIAEGSHSVEPVEIISELSSILAPLMNETTFPNHFHDKKSIVLITINYAKLFSYKQVFHFGDESLKMASLLVSKFASEGFIDVDYTNALILYHQARLRIAKAKNNLYLSDCEVILGELKKAVLLLENGKDCGYHLAAVFCDLGQTYFHLFLFTADQNHLSQANHYWEKSHNAIQLAQAEFLANSEEKPQYTLQELILRRERVRAQYWVSSDQAAACEEKMDDICRSISLINPHHFEVGITLIEKAFIKSCAMQWEAAKDFCHQAGRIFLLSFAPPANTKQHAITQLLASLSRFYVNKGLTAKKLLFLFAVVVKQELKNVCAMFDQVPTSLTNELIHFLLNELTSQFRDVEHPLKEKIKTIIRNCQNELQQREGGNPLRYFREILVEYDRFLAVDYEDLMQNLDSVSTPRDATAGARQFLLQAGVFRIREESKIAQKSEAEIVNIIEQCLT